MIGQRASLRVAGLQILAGAAKVLSKSALLAISFHRSNRPRAVFPPLEPTGPTAERRVSRRPPLWRDRR